MTLDQIQALTEEEIRVKVAELLGTHIVTVLPFDGGTMTHVTDERGRIRAIRQMNDGPRAEECPRDWIAPPNYPADLNACAEMERTLNLGQRADYLRVLCSVLNGWAMLPDATTTFAPARARCEAFVAVMGGKPL